MFGKFDKIIWTVLLFVFFFFFISCGSAVRNSNDFFSAIENGQINDVRELIESGKASADLTNPDTGISALAYAINGGYIGIASFLLIHGADINSIPEDIALENTILIETAQYFAFHFDEIQIIGPARDNPIFYASEGGLLSTVCHLLSRGVDPNQHDINGRTPLMAAIAHNNNDIVLVLLENGARTNIQDYLGNSALMIAVQSGNKRAIEMLLEYDAELNVKNTIGRTALMYAVLEGNLEVISLLIGNGARLDIRNTDGKTALDLALENGNNEIADFINNHVN